MTLRTTSREERILLIDDDEFIAGSLRRYLDVQGRAADCASDRKLAIAFMEMRGYSVVVVDPYLTGSLGEGPSELLATVRTLQPRAAIVVITAYATPQLELLGRVFDVSAMLAKPQSITTVHGVVAGHLGSRAKQTLVAGRPYY